jgi:TonB-dependent receptor
LEKEFLYNNEKRDDQMCSYTDSQITRSILFFFLSISLVLFPSNLLQGQTNKSGRVTGRITDSKTGAPLPSASIIIAETEAGTVSNDRGYYMLRNVPPGTNTVRVSYIGFEKTDLEVVVESDRTVRLDVGLHTLKPSSYEGDEAELKLGLSRAYMEQSTSISHKYVMPAEQMEMFGDVNLVESIMRFPGTNSNYSVGEPSGLIIRGMNMNKNLVQLDGVAMVPTTIGDRGTGLDGLSDRMVSAVEIIRMPTADMPADALGGIVNLRTVQPVAGQSVLRLYTIGKYGAMSGKFGPRLALLYGGRIGKLGYTVQSEYQKAYYEQDRIDLQWQNTPDTPTVSQAIAAYDSRESERYGVSGRVQYDMNETSRFFVSGLYHNSEASYSIEEYRISPVEGTITRAGNNFNIENGLIELFPRIREESTSFYAVTAGGIQTFGTIGIDYSFSRLMSENSIDTDRTVEWRNGESGFAIENNNFGIPAFTFDGGSVYNADRYLFHRDTDETGQIDRMGYAGAINFEIPFSITRYINFDIKFGGQYRYQEKDRTAFRYMYENADTADVRLTDFAGMNTWSFIGNARLENGPKFDFTKWDPWFESNKGQFAFRTDRYNEFLLNENSVKETVLASYLMTTAHIGPTSITAGVRLEKTNGKYQGNVGERRNANEMVILQTDERETDYTDIFPSLHIRHNFTPNTVFRVAVAYGMKRPSFSDLIPRKEYNYITRRIYEGNPDLNPMKVIRGQLSVEHYFQQIGQVSAAFFFNEYKDFIYLREIIGWDPAFAGWRLLTPQNGELTQYFGTELTWQQSLTFLPGRLENLSIFSNFTYIVSRKSVEEPFIRTVQNPGLRPWELNFGLSYVYGGFAGLIITNHTESYLTDASILRFRNAVMDQYQSSTLTLDILLKQRIARFVQISINIKNILNTNYTDRYSIVGDEDDPYYTPDIPKFTTQYRESGIHGSVGLRVDL